MKIKEIFAEKVNKCIRFKVCILQNGLGNKVTVNNTRNETIKSTFTDHEVNVSKYDEEISLEVPPLPKTVQNFCVMSAIPHYASLFPFFEL